MKNEDSLTPLSIGQRIHQEIERQQCDVSWLAHEIGCCRTNIYKICGRSSVDTNTLIRLSLALHHNFLEEISNFVETKLNEDNEEK